MCIRDRPRAVCPNRPKDTAPRDASKNPARAVKAAIKVMPGLVRET